MLAKVLTVEAKNPTANYDSSTGTINITETVSVKQPTYGYLAYRTLQVGDVITAIAVNSGDAKNITRAYQVDDICMTLVEGDTVTIYYTRSGVSSNITFTVTSGYISSVA